jgi:putative ABC transport system ATP-binding protein
MGPSGSGKTTLLSMLGGLLKPSAGRIQIGPDEISAMDERQLPEVRLRRIGFIFQDFNLLSALSCLDNVAIVSQLAGLSRSEARRRARQLLEQLGLGHRLNFPPEKLSGGEKQRVAIARALANQPDLILADEPTANLDSHHGYETMRLLRQIAQEENRSVVIVSHDQRIKDIADRLLWLEDGQFKNIVEMAIDPVCGMSVDREHAPARTDYDGRVLYFCARGCRDEFLIAPEKFLTS